MRRKTHTDFHPEVMQLFDKFVHGVIDRRGFLSGVAKYTTAGVTASMLLDQLSPQFAAAQVVSKTDPRIVSRTIEFTSPEGYGKASGLMVRPANASSKLPGVLVIHENRGLNPHIEDIARRIALDGFVAFAPDALFPLGGYAGDEDKARDAFAKLDQPKTQRDFVAAAEFLKNMPECNGKIGAVGFCYGGGVVNMLATRVPDLRAAVPFYGAAPATADVPKIKAAVQAHYAETDERINAAWPAYEAAMKAAGVRHSMYKYPGTLHGFNNDTTPRFVEAAAKLAWARTMDFFKSTLA